MPVKRRPKLLAGRRLPCASPGCRAKQVYLHSTLRGPVCRRCYRALCLCAGCNRQRSGENASCGFCIARLLSPRALSPEKGPVAAPALRVSNAGRTASAVAAEIAAAAGSPSASHVEVVLPGGVDSTPEDVSFATGHDVAVVAESSPSHDVPPGGMGSVPGNSSFHTPTREIVYMARDVISAARRQASVRTSVRKVSTGTTPRRGYCPNPAPRCGDSVLAGFEPLKMLLATGEFAPDCKRAVRGSGLFLFGGSAPKRGDCLRSLPSVYFDCRWRAESLPPLY